DLTDVFGHALCRARSSRGSTRRCPRANLAESHCFLGDSWGKHDLSRVDPGPDTAILLQLELADSPFVNSYWISGHYRWRASVARRCERNHPLADRSSATVRLGITPDRSIWIHLGAHRRNPAHSEHPFLLNGLLRKRGRCLRWGLSVSVGYHGECLG